MIYDPTGAFAITDVLAVPLILLGLIFASRWVLAGFEEGTSGMINEEMKQRIRQFFFGRNSNSEPP
jgi:hypothetical protein